MPKQRDLTFHLIQREKTPPPKLHYNLYVKIRLARKRRKKITIILTKTIIPRMHACYSGLLIFNVGRNFDIVNDIVYWQAI